MYSQHQSEWQSFSVSPLTAHYQHTLPHERSHIVHQYHKRAALITSLPTCLRGSSSLLPARVSQSSALLISTFCSTFVPSLPPATTFVDVMSNYQRLNEPLNNAGYPEQPYAAALPPQPQYAQPYPPPNAEQHYNIQQQQQPLYAQPAPLAAPYPPVVAQVGSPGHLLVHGQWSDGIFDCFDSASICVISLFLPFLRWSTTVSRLRYLSFPSALMLSTPPFLLYTVLYVYLNVRYPSTYGTDAVESYGAIYFVLLTVMIVAHLTFVALGAYYRGKVRREYNVNGNVMEDCCWHFCCGCCAIAQEARHVDRDFGFPV